jgi:hypothetical protein
MRKQSMLLPGAFIAAAVALCVVAMAPAARAEVVPKFGKDYTHNHSVPKHHAAKPLYDSVGTRSRYGYHPNAQGGTTGGTVNPGVNGDHRSHGYNGG